MVHRPRRRRSARMGIEQAARIDRLQELLRMETTDGIVPSPRASAMLDWLHAEHMDWYRELQDLVRAVKSEGVGPTMRWPASEDDPAYLAYARRLDELWTLWNHSGHPDPAGRLRHIH